MRRPAAISRRSGADPPSSAVGTVTFRRKPGCSPSGSLRVRARNAGLESNSSLRNNMNSKHYPINPSGAAWLSTRAPLAPARRRFRQLRQLLAWLAVVTVPFAPACAQGSVSIATPTLVVAPFTIAFNEWLPRGHSAIGDALASFLITELSRTGRFDLLESSALSDLRTETQVGGRGWGELAMPGGDSQWAGADFVLYSKLMEAQHSAQTAGSAGPLVLPPIFRSNKHLTRVQIDWRLVQVANRKIVATGQAIGEEKGVSSGLAQGLGADSFQTTQFRDSAMGKAINKAIAAIASELDQVSLPPSERVTATSANQLPTPTPESASPAVPPATGQVAASAGGGVVVVSLGAKHGLKLGDRLQLFELVDLKDESGQVIFSEEKAAGEVLLDAVNEDRSKGQYTGPSTPKVGWLVKKK